MYKLYYYKDLIDLNENINKSTIKKEFIQILNNVKNDKFLISLNKIINVTPIYLDKSNRLFDDNTTKLLFEYYFLSTLSIYIKQFDIFKMNEEVDFRYIEQIKTIVIKLLVSYVNIMSENKKLMDVSYKKVYDIEFKMKETEKYTYTDRLKQLTIEQRNIDTNLKAYKLGVWGKGLKKDLYTYVENLDDIDVNIINKLKQLEKENLENQAINLESEDFITDLINNPNINEEVDSDIEHGDSDEDDVYDDNEYDNEDEYENNDFDDINMY